MNDKRQTFWVSGIDFKTYRLRSESVVTGFITPANPLREEAIHVTELREGEIVIDRKEFIKRWNYARDFSVDYSDMRDVMLRELFGHK